MPLRRRLRAAFGNGGVKVRFVRCWALHRPAGGTVARVFVAMELCHAETAPLDCPYRDGETGVEDLVKEEPSVQFGSSFPIDSPFGVPSAAVKHESKLDPSLTPSRGMVA